MTSYHHHLLWCPPKSIKWTRDPLAGLPPPLPMGAFLLPTSSSLCAPPLPLSVLGQHRPPGHWVCDTPSLNPASSTFPSRCRPPPYFAQPLCTPPPLIFAWATSTPRCCNMQHPLTPHGGLLAPRGYLSLVPSPSPYQCLVWRLTVHWGTCSSHGCFPLLSDLRWSTYPPFSWPGSGTSSVLPWSPAQPGGPGLRLWALATCLIVRTLRSRSCSLDLGLYLPRLGCLGVP